MLGRALDLLRDLVAPPSPPRLLDPPLPVVHVRLAGALRPVTGLAPWEVRLVGAEPLVVRVWALDQAGAIDVGRELVADRRLRPPGGRASDALVARRLAA